MKNDKSGRIWQAKRKLSDRHGVTMVELLVVVAIIAILSGVSFIAVYRYQRSLGQVERDGIAKEIFVAAQNHLTVAKGEGYLGLADSAFGEPKSETVTVEGEPKTVTVYYIVVNHGSAFTANGSHIVDQMLPFGSIDESIRTGGNYIIRYQKETGFVLDVFYCSRSGSPKVFNRDEFKSVDYTGDDTVFDYQGSSKKAARRNWKDGSILGWYGGVEAIALRAETLQAPVIQVVNKETLSVIVTNNNVNKGGLRLLIKGKQSGVEHYLDVLIGDSTTTLVLDDITSPSTANRHFCKLQFDDMKQKSPPDINNDFIPGEDITVQAVAYNNSTLSNIAFSAELTTNSLFASVEDRVGSDSVPDTAYISNFRHLENLDRVISGLGYVNNDDHSDAIGIVAAVQTTNLNWSNDTLNNTVAAYWSSAKITDVSGAALSADDGKYVPISPAYSLTYNGKNHSISNVTASGTNAGLFGSVTTVSSISNLELIDFTITGTNSAGALAGTLKDCTVSNVLARNRSKDSTAVITAPDAGGLVGIVSNAATDEYGIEKSAAAVPVVGANSAGGLVGTCMGTVTDCYSGGRTDSGEYYSHDATTGARTTPIYNVSSSDGYAGGLIGNAGGTSIRYSYSTCSVFGHTAAGGLAGDSTGEGTIKDCYCTGLVGGDGSKYAFVGSGPLHNDSTGNYYYSTINQIPKAGGRDGETEPMQPISGYSLGANLNELKPLDLNKLKPLDLNTGTYSSFTGDWENWAPAQAYDSVLATYYSNKYNLKSIEELHSSAVGQFDFVSTHYGDWPSPEVFFKNIK